MPLLSSPPPKSFLPFFPSLFSFRPSLPPPAFSLILSPQGAAEFTALLPVTLHSAGADLFFTSPPTCPVCASGRMANALGQH